MAAAGCLMAQNPAPVSVQNPASNILPGLPNFGIAQGSIFVVYGTNLGPSTITVAPSLRLPTALSSLEYLVVGSMSNPVQFTAPGLDFGYVLVGGASGGSVTFQ